MEKQEQASVITLLDGPHRVEPPSPNAIIYLEGLGYSFSDAFEAVGLASDPETLKADIAKTVAEHLAALEKDPDAVRPAVDYEVSLKAIRDHIAAILIDSGEDISLEEVGRLLDVARVSDYAGQILTLGSTGPFGSRRQSAS